MAASRLEPLDPPFDPEIAAELERIMPAGVDPLKLFRTLAHNPRVLLRVFGGGLLDRGSIDLRDREIVILRTCARCGSEYEWGVHVSRSSPRRPASPKAEVAATVLGGRPPIRRGRRASRRSGTAGRRTARYQPN